MVTGPHVGPQWSYVPWLAVTAGWGGTVFEVGGGFWQGGPYTGSSHGPGPQPRTGRGKGCWGVSREKWGGAWGRGQAVMDRAGAGSAGPGSGHGPSTHRSLARCPSWRRRRCPSRRRRPGPVPELRRGGCWRRPAAPERAGRRRRQRPLGLLRWLRRRDPRQAPASRVSPRPPAREPQPKSLLLSVTLPQPELIGPGRRD